MKSIGIIRNIDEMGRVCLPQETRKMLNMDSGDPIEFYVQDDAIVIKRYQKGCTFCGSTEGVKDFYGRKLCRGCMDKIAKVLG